MPQSPIDSVDNDGAIREAEEAVDGDTTRRSSSARPPSAAAPC